MRTIMIMSYKTGIITNTHTEIHALHSSSIVPDGSFCLFALNVNDQQVIMYFGQVHGE